MTIRDVARLAGVAPITVSRAIREPDTVTPPVMERISHAIRATGYIPNAIAGALSSGDSRLVAAVVSSISTLTLHPMLEALTGTLNTAGYQVLLGQEGYDGEKGDRLLQAILSRKPTGIVLTGLRTTDTWRQWLKSSGIPVVEVWNVVEDPIDMSVGFSHSDVARAVVDFLYEKGRRRLAIYDRRYRFWPGIAGNGTYQYGCLVVSPVLGFGMERWALREYAGPDTYHDSAASGNVENLWDGCRSSRGESWTGYARTHHDRHV